MQKMLKMLLRGLSSKTKHNFSHNSSHCRLRCLRFAKNVCRLHLVFFWFHYIKNIQVFRYSEYVCAQNNFFQEFILQYQTIILKCEFGLLMIYISKLIPMIGKLIGTHFIVRFVCQKPHRTLKKGLRAPQAHINCVLGNI